MVPQIRSLPSTQRTRPAARSSPRRPRVVLTAACEAISDEVLLGRYRDSARPEDFEELVRRYADRLGHRLSRSLRDPSLAEDVLQEVFLQIHTGREQYRDGRPARPWLYAVAAHRAIDAVRRSRRLPAIRLDQPPARDGETGRPLSERLASDKLGPPEELLERERLLWLRRSVDRLPAPLREVLVLSYDLDLTRSEIAARLGIPAGTVKSRLHYAIGRLREMAEAVGDRATLG